MTAQFELAPNEEFVSPFELNVGDQIKHRSRGLVTVTETRRPARSIGEALCQRQGYTPEPADGDAYFLMFCYGSGIHGAWDGKSGFVRVRQVA